MRLRRAVVAGSLFVVAAAASDLGVYQLLVVPRLAHWSAVPLLWWVCVFAPVLLVVGVLASRARNYADLWQSGSAVSLCGSLYLHWAARLEQAGHLKSLAVEVPLVFWLGAPLTLLILFIAPASVIHWACSTQTRSR